MSNCILRARWTFVISAIAEAPSISFSTYTVQAQRVGKVQNTKLNVPRANKLAIGTGNGLVRYGILLLVRLLTGEVEDCRG